MEMVCVACTFLKNSKASVHLILNLTICYQVDPSNLRRLKGELVLPGKLLLQVHRINILSTKLIWPWSWRLSMKLKIIKLRPGLTSPPQLWTVMTASKLCSCSQEVELSPEGKEIVGMKYNPSEMDWSYYSSGYNEFIVWYSVIVSFYR